MDGKEIGKILIKSLIIVLALAYLWTDKLVIWNIGKIFLGQILLVALALYIGGRITDAIIK